METINMEAPEQKITSHHIDRVTRKKSNASGLEQDHAAYDNEDKLVWQILFERQMSQLKKYAIQEFLDCVETIGFHKDEIPNFEKLNQGVLKEHGWQIEVVKGIIPVEDFFTLLSHKKFPCSAWIRPMSSLDYLEEPDMFHDVFGHLPLLLNPKYNTFFKWIAKKAIENLGNEKIIAELQRLYWYTIEFGLCKEKGELKVYGAGLLSSIGETKFALSETPKKIDYNLKEVLQTNFHTDSYQDHYFVVENLDALTDSIDK
jgi:phenylalanine-4-hydroxylase